MCVFKNKIKRTLGVASVPFFGGVAGEQKKRNTCERLTSTLKMFIIETIHTTNLEPGILDCHLKAVSLHPSTELLFMALADLISKQVHMWRRLTVATLAQLSTSRTCLSLRQIGSLQPLRYPWTIWTTILFRQSLGAILWQLRLFQKEHKSTNMSACSQ